MTTTTVRQIPAVLAIRSNHKSSQKNLRMQLLEITEILLIYNFYKIEMWQDLKLVFICVCSISQFAAKSHTSEDSAISPQALDH